MCLLAYFHISCDIITIYHGLLLKWTFVVTFGGGSSDQPRADESLPLLQANDAHLGEGPHVVVQLLAQILYGRKKEHGRRGKNR